MVVFRPIAVTLIFNSQAVNSFADPAWDCSTP